MRKYFATDVKAARYLSPEALKQALAGKGASQTVADRTGEPVNAADLEKILCERALLENEDAEAAPCLPSGIAAADGLLSITRPTTVGARGGGASMRRPSFRAR